MPALAKSIYLWLAVTITAICYPLWSKVDFFTEARPSVEMALTIIPSLMAFSLGGVAVFMALSGRRFQTAIRQGGSDKSLFMKAVTALFHFLVVQTLALVAALVASAYPGSDVTAAISFFLMAYSITAALATAAVLFNISRIFNVAVDDDKPS